jgi:hypothetical protein
MNIDEENMKFFNYNTNTSNLINFDMSTALNDQLIFPRTFNKYGEPPMPELTNLGGRIGEQSSRLFRGYYSGPGMRSNQGLDVDTESNLIQGSSTIPYAEAKEENLMKFRFNTLPPCCTPQNVSHLIPPPPSKGGWVRGGDNSRDNCRRNFNNYNH